MAKKKRTGVTREDVAEVIGATSESVTRQIPALGEYLRRIGAEEINFRKWIVKQYHNVQRHYYTERMTVEVTKEGEIICRPGYTEYFPTDKERADIAKGMEKVKLPFWTPSTVQAAEAQKDVIEEEMRNNDKIEEGTVYLFYSVDRSNILMLQQMVKINGLKYYIPWTQWSDGKWRKMEPEGKLPLWKPSVDRGKSRVMVHEGAKAASYIDSLINDEDMKDVEHPWREDFEDYEHWGMIGGALAPSRTDYTELYRKSFKELVYIADNDNIGIAAVTTVSKNYGRQMSAVIFRNHFETGFDLADPLPEKFYAKTQDGRRIWTFGSLHDIMEDATWATVIKKEPGEKKKIIEINPDFRDNWFYTVDTELFVNRKDPGVARPKTAFDTLVCSYSDVENTSNYMKRQAVSQVKGISYRPDLAPGPYKENDDNFINTYVGSRIKADYIGDPKPFLDYIDHLVTIDRDRHNLKRWIATLIARPDIRMSYAVLMVSSTQGVGKTTLGEKILAPLVGMNNTSFPSESTLVDSQFNSWMVCKRLAVVNEIYAGHSGKAYNRLKSVISDDDFTVNQKYIPEYRLKNWTHILASSNSMRALQLQDDDRRWFLPKIVEERKPFEYWERFNHWLKFEGGLQIIKAWAEKFVEDPKNIVRPGEHAPFSDIKQEAIEDSDSAGLSKLREIIRYIKSIIANETDDAAQILSRWKNDRSITENGEFVLIDTQIVKFIKDVVHEGRPTQYIEKPLTVRKFSMGLGLCIGSIRISPGMPSGWSQWAGGRVITNSRVLAGLSPADIGGARALNPIKPIDLSSIYSQNLM